MPRFGPNKNFDIHVVVLPQLQLKYAAAIVNSHLMGPSIVG